jgi:hypothetical protein
MPQQPTPAEARVAARLVAAGHPVKQAAQALGVNASHLRRTLDRALTAGERQALRDADEYRALRAELAGGFR